MKLRRGNRYRIDIITADVTRKHVQDSDGIARQCSKISNAEMFQKIGASQNRKRRMLVSDEQQGITQLKCISLLGDFKHRSFKKPELSRVLRILAPPHNLPPVDRIRFLLACTCKKPHIIVR